MKIVLELLLIGPPALALASAVVFFYYEAITGIIEDLKHG